MGGRGPLVGLISGMLLVAGAWHYWPEISTVTRNPARPWRDVREEPSPVERGTDAIDSEDGSMVMVISEATDRMGRPLVFVKDRRTGREARFSYHHIRASLKGLNR